MPSKDTQFKKGQGGRPPGVANKFTRTVRETVLEVFKTAQDDPELCLMALCRNNPDLFYQIAAKLIPNEVRAEVSSPEGIQITFIKDADSPPIGTDPESNFGLPGESSGL
jgi:hypothetical protein